MSEKSPGRKAKPEHTPLAAPRANGAPDVTLSAGQIVLDRTIANRVESAQKLATGAIDLLRIYQKAPEPAAARALVDDARTRLQLALEQLTPRVADL